MMEERIIKELEQGKTSPFTQALLEHVKDLVELSRAEMNKHYLRWDTYDDVYRGYRYPDKADLEARKKEEPEKMVVPLAFAQISTFVAFCLTLYTQREDIVEVVPKGPEDELAAKLAEALIARDLHENQFVIKLKQFLTDIARFSLGVFKHTWSREVETVRASAPIEGSGMVTEVGYQEKVKFLGNRIENISPYRFFPDVRVPLTRFQEGEFCASEDEYTITELKRQQRDKKIAGVKHIQGWSQDVLIDRMRKSRLFSQNVYDKGPVGQSKGTCVVTEAQVWLCPNDFELANGEKLGEEDYPVLYVVTYANDETLLRVEPMNYVHNKFTYDVAEFNPDQHTFINVSLSEIMDMLQMTVSWFLNSHITSVRRVIQNRLIIDPTGLEMEDLKQDRAYIRLNMSAAGGDVRRYVQQMQVSDVTTNHVRDAEVLHQLMMTVTGISENALGQYASGRRSATEARNVNFNAASRLKTVAQTIYYQALEPMFSKLIANLRDGLDVDTYVRLRGDSSDPAEFGYFKVSREMLVGNYDFGIFDATLPSEKGYIAQQIGDLLQVMMGSPEAIPMFGYDPRKLLDKMFELRGLRHLQSLKLPQQPYATPGIAQEQGPNINPAGAGVLPTQPAFPVNAGVAPMGS
jgi:hypothetical protein